MTDTPDEIIEHRVCFCPECGKDVSGLPFELFGKRQVIDIPTIRQVVTEHRVYRGKCTCGKVVESDFPVGVDSPVRYGKKHWFWTWQNKRATFIAASGNRGTNTIDENVSGISQEAVLVHDCWKAHFQTPVKAHQLCTAHLERETKYLEERYKVAWPVRFRAILRQAHKLKKQLTPADYYYPNHPRNLLERELDNLLAEHLDPKHKEMIAFQKRITRYRDHVFTLSLSSGCTP